MLLLYVMGFLAWAVPTAAGIWYLMTFREMQMEIRTIRRYLQDLHGWATAYGSPAPPGSKPEGAGQGR